MKFISKNAKSKATPSKVIKYVMNPKKCCKDENGEIIMSTIGLDNDRPYSEQFRETAELAGNNYTNNDRKYYHFKYTVSPEDYSPDGPQNITPKQLLREAEDFAQENFPGYQAVITIQYHDNGKTGEQQNEEHLHAHIVINASSFDLEQNKLRLSKKDLDNLRDYAYEAGLKYNLNERYWLDEVNEKRKQERENQADPKAINLSTGEKIIFKEHGKNFADYSWKEQYRIAIDEAKGATTNLDSFQGYLKEHFHIDVQITKEGNIKYKFPERTTYSSGKALGADYTINAVEKALQETKNKPTDLPKEPTVEQRRALEWRQKFDEEYAKFQKWQEEEYQKQREEWLKTEKENDLSSSEYYRNKTVLEHTTNLYQLVEQTKYDEYLKTVLTDKERAEIQELEQHRAELAEQQQYAQIGAAFRNGQQEANFELERIRERQDQKRQDYINILQTAGTDLADKIMAAQNIHDMNVAEGRKKDYQSQAQEIYGKDTRRHTIYAKRDWKAQKLYDSLRVARELGANNSAELELKVKQEGREYGKIKREYTEAKKQYDEAVKTAIANLPDTNASSIEEWNKKVEEIKSTEYEKLRPIEEKFQAAKEHYKECAQALDTVKANNAENSLYITDKPQQQEEKKKEAPQRTKEEAEKERKQQWSELRDWSDDAVKKVAEKNTAGKENDLKEWAAEMEKHGCTVRITANTISVKHPDSKQAVRTNRLGGDYEKEAIENGIQMVRYEERNRTNNREQTTGNSIRSSREEGTTIGNGIGKRNPEQRAAVVENAIRGIEQKVAGTAGVNKSTDKTPDRSIGKDLHRQRENERQS